ncbi:MAG: DUF3426 domain-containing protein [Betaproteobacteria bacterium]|nr:DUF3426 domain-containing protein [Betaproteobacteria bacterium]
MSTVTTCPHCRTVFRITLEQLSARQGDVRCGHCAQVFNAFDALVSQGAPAPQDRFEAQPHATHPPDATPAPRAGAEVPPAPAEAAAPEAMDWPELPPPWDAGEADRSLAPVGEAEIVLGPPAEGPGETAAGAAEGLGPSPAFEAWPTADTIVLEPLAPEHAPGDELPASDVILLEPLAPEPDDKSPREEEEEPRRARARKGIPGWVLALGSFLSALALAGQLAYVYRVALAARLPAVEPALAAGCALLGCSIPLPHEINRISIDSYEMTAQPNQPSVVVLRATLRNAAPYPEAFPLLELTLTNDANQVLARRILRPVDYAPPGTNIGQGIAGHDVVSVTRYLSIAGLNASGYTLYPFYR